MAAVQDKIKKIIAEAAGANINQVKLEHPELEQFGDYSTNIALALKGGRKLADEIAGKIKKDELIEGVNVAGPGFINITLSKKYLIGEMEKIKPAGDGYGKSDLMKGRKMMVEFAHPNTHKELHIGHMRTLITGEAISRILSNAGATVFRANYQGDIGPHVAKAIWGTTELLRERKMSWDDAEKLEPLARAHLLGEGYIRGNQDYEEKKKEIDGLNSKIYAGDLEIKEIYERTRRWSLVYYDIFYSRFGTKFDRLFFESEVAAEGKQLVQQNTPRVFEVSEGAVIFDGEKYGLHKRVFITKDGNPTYEGKEMALAYLQYKTFPFDTVIHVVANEQTGYFQVVIKALELIDPIFSGREFHLSMGMVNLVGRKMSSRTGEIMTVDGMLDEVRLNLPVKTEDGHISEVITLGAVKYSVLKTHPTMNVTFDIKQSVNLEGNSGPYLQYTFARTQSVIVKAGVHENYTSENYGMNTEEEAIVRYLHRYSEVAEEAALRYSPNLICNYLYELAQRFNKFYNQHSILSADNQETIEFRLKITTAIGQVIKNGLKLLGIEALERM
jgi:arginyl-tRNA synthetase